MEREMIEFRVTCLDSGSWDEPQFWPGCVQTVHCGSPPPKHEIGLLSWLSLLSLSNLLSLLSLLSLLNFWLLSNELC